MYPCIYIPCCTFKELSGNMCNKASKSAWCTKIGIILCNWTTVNRTTQFLYCCESRNWLWILWGNLFWLHDNLYELGVSQLFDLQFFNLLFLLLRCERKVSVESRELSLPVSQYLSCPQNKWQDFSYKIKIWMRLVLKKIKGAFLFKRIVLNLLHKYL